MAIGEGLLRIKPARLGTRLAAGWNHPPLLQSRLASVPNESLTAPEEFSSSLDQTARWSAASIHWLQAV